MAKDDDFFDKYVTNTPNSKRKGSVKKDLFGAKSKSDEKKPEEKVVQSQIDLDSTIEEDLLKTKNSQKSTRKTKVEADTMEESKKKTTAKTKKLLAI